MKTALAWRAGAASDTGLTRPNNEDRVLVEEALGIFLVVDGLGGHAAGEVAAQAAIDIIRDSLHTAESSDVDEKIRQAICAANNEIFALAQTRDDWSGMACVLTLAIAQHDRVHVGHVGDSRLYLLSNGKLRKLTSDHSPVGEQEDQGELTEEQAMRHPRRNEVFRDVGSVPHMPHDEQFVETMSFLFRTDAALLLCSDGLSDYVTSAEMTAILERYDGDPGPIAQQLIEAANAAGGRDNISAIVIAGADFLGTQSKASQGVRARHATTRMRRQPRRWRRTLLAAGLLIAGMALGGLLISLFGWSWLDHLAARPAVVKEEPPIPPAPRTIVVNAANARGILDALNSASSGDTITVPPGEYLGPLLLKDHVNLIAATPRQVIVRSDPAATVDQGLGIVARHIEAAQVKGLRVLADDLHPLKIGILIDDSSPELSDIEVAGAIESGVRIQGDSHPLLLGDSIHSNPGAGIVIRDEATPRLAGNRISDNGLVPAAPRSGIETSAGAKPLLEDNTVVHNGLRAPASPTHREPPVKATSKDR